MQVRVMLARRASNRAMSIKEKGATGKDADILVLRVRVIVRRAWRGGRFAAMIWRPFI